MVKRVVVKKNRYFDSVYLMQVARRMAAEPGIRDAFAQMATDANRKVLADLGYEGSGHGASFDSSGPNDLMLAVEGDEAAVTAILDGAEAWLSGRPEVPASGGQRERAPRSIAEAVAAKPECTVALVSVPGEYAAREARAALEAGLHVFLFSSRVPIEAELALKMLARKRGLLVMGPDCGTSYISGAGLGFANAVRRGPVGVVGSTGTGMQEFASLVHQAGSGLSHGIGTGSRDLSDGIGGLSTMAAIDALEADPETRVITILSKPPGEGARARLLERLARIRKPVVLCLLGSQPCAPGSLHQVSTIDEAVGQALEAIGLPAPESLRFDARAMRARAAEEAGKMRMEQRYVRGLFSGGTFCYQSQAIFLCSGLPVYSNAPLHWLRDLSDPGASHEHAFIDMGAERFVEGRPHPMIDATLRRQRIRQEGKDPTVAFILLDVVLGANASKDPAGDLLDAIQAAQKEAQRSGRHLGFVASVCGTDGDAQGLQSQTRALSDAGVLVFPSNALAAAYCREAALMLMHRKEVEPCR